MLKNPSKPVVWIPILLVLILVILFFVFKPYESPTAATITLPKIAVTATDPSDSNTDDTAAIQAVIDQAKEGEIVYLPNGIYNITTLVITTSGIKD